MCTYSTKYTMIQNRAENTTNIFQKNTSPQNNFTSKLTSINKLRIATNNSFDHFFLQKSKLWPFDEARQDQINHRLDGQLPFLVDTVSSARQGSHAFLLPLTSESLTRGRFHLSVEWLLKKCIQHLSTAQHTTKMVFEDNTHAWSCLLLSAWKWNPLLEDGHRYPSSTHPTAETVTLALVTMSLVSLLEQHPPG